MIVRRSATFKFADHCPSPHFPLHTKDFTSQHNSYDNSLKVQDNTSRLSQIIEQEPKSSLHRVVTMPV